MPRTPQSKPVAVADMPSCSADGLKIAFKRLPASSEIFTMNLDGSAQTNITLSAGDEEYPDWSPDSQQIAVQMSGDVYKMGTDGSGPTNLTNSAAVDKTPAWSPDGASIAYSSNGPTPDIYTMNADGTAPTKLTATADNSFPDWQPTAPPDPPSTPDPPSPPAVPETGDTTAPQITSLKITRRFTPAPKAKTSKRRARSGAKITLKLSEAARTKFTVQRKTRGITVKRKVKGLSKTRSRCVANTGGTDGSSLANSERPPVTPCRLANSNAEFAEPGAPGFRSS